MVPGLSTVAVFRAAEDSVAAASLAVVDLSVGAELREAGDGKK